MSQALAKLAVGESMQMKGPKGRLTYTPNMANHIGKYGCRACSSSAPIASAACASSPTCVRRMEEGEKKGVQGPPRSMLLQRDRMPPAPTWPHRTNACHMTT